MQKYWIRFDQNKDVYTNILAKYYVYMTATGLLKVWKDSY